MEKVRSFNELTSEQKLLAGGKGGTLSRLYQAHYPVPEGFVILPAAFVGDELAGEAWAQVQAHLGQMRSGGTDIAFAVRSSASGEDSAQASFAGEFETVLNVRAEEDIREAIHVVRQSRLNERVQAYSRAKGIDVEHEVAVVVQRMVQADISGVVFTADPVTGSRATMMGNYLHGLGDQLVAGEATGEAFTIKKPGGEYEGPAELKRHASRLYKLGSRLEKELGCPQDVEWAVADGELYLLQSRPITTTIGYNPATGAWNASLTGDYLWSNVNFGEAVSDVMTPLTWTVLRLIFGEWMILPGYQSVGNIGGRPYLNISIFASMFRAIGKSRQALLDALEGTLYMRLPEEMEIPVIPLSRWRLPSILANLIRVRMKERKGVKDLPAYLAANPAQCRRMQQRIGEAGTKAELISIWRAEILPHVTQSVWTVMGSVSQSVDYTMGLRRELTELVGPDDAGALLSNLSEGSGELASLGPLVGLAKVARGEMGREAYLESYGHRGPHEFELSIPRPAEDPDWVDQQVARFSRSPVDVEALLEKQRAEFDAAWERFKVRYPRKAKFIRRRIGEGARRGRMREAARSEYVRDRWIVRAFALRAGELTGLGDDIFFLTLDEVLEVLSGKKTAIDYIPARKETYGGYRATPSYPSIIRGRFDPFQWAADPERRSDLFDAHAPLPALASSEDGSNVILGSPGAAGLVEGVVRRLARPEDGDQLQAGEVLVAMQTDIAWTLLFPRATAIVTDVGAPLSHAAIVARELGIPAVVGCGNAMMRLKTGDRVRVDGGRGTVEILSGDHLH
jgi:phosphohistidine swiveling domain-containing protein